MNGTELPPGWQPEPPAAWPALGSGPLAIVFMLHTPGLPEHEFYALETLRSHGEDHPRFLLVPEGMRIGFAHEDFRVVPLPAGNFASRAACNAISPAPNRATGGVAASLDLTRMGGGLMAQSSGHFEPGLEWRAVLHDGPEHVHTTPGESDDGLVVSFS
ncbi:MAG: hypothetical protein O9325_17045, partial [Roseomonas sp.]|nr:hypothetical protein [Roseomonas sp.]